jgi:hypothetical protein
MKSQVGHSIRVSPSFDLKLSGMFTNGNFPKGTDLDDQSRSAPVIGGPALAIDESMAPTWHITGDV